MKLFLQDVQNLNTIIHLPDCFCGIHYSTFRHHYSDCLQCQTHIEPSSIWCIKDTTVSSVLEFYVQLYNNHAVRWYIIKCEKTPPSFIKTEKNGLLFFIKSESFCNRLRYRCRHRTTKQPPDVDIEQPPDVDLKIKCFLLRFMWIWRLLALL